MTAILKKILIIIDISGCDTPYSAQLVKIWFRGALCPLIGTNLKNFVYYHVSHLPPDFILNKNNVSLLSVNNTHTIFAMTKHSVDVYNFSR